MSIFNYFEPYCITIINKELIIGISKLTYLRNNVSTLLTL